MREAPTQDEEDTACVDVQLGWVDGTSVYRSWPLRLDQLPHL